MPGGNAPVLLCPDLTIGYFQVNRLPARLITMDFPELETERLILRAVAPGDRFAIFENYSDPAVAGWFFDQPYTRIQQADQIIQEFIQRPSAPSSLTASPCSI